MYENGIMKPIKNCLSQPWWLMPVILATWEAEIERMPV
jgi:hypothetical protein